MDGANASIKRWLWRKESRQHNALYIDYFATTLENDFRKFVADRVRDAQREQIEKNTAVSTHLQKLGAREFRKRKWREATELYNRGVCTAENGSSNLRLAYTARSNCFAKRGMNEEASIDIDLSSEPTTKVSKRRSDRIQNRKVSITTEMKRMFIPNKKFPNLASALEVRQNSKFGRHVVAK